MGTKKKLGPHERRASVNRHEHIRSRYQRCPKCKKLRMKWKPANWVWHDKEGKDTTKRWGKDPVLKVLVCHICLSRL